MDIVLAAGLWLRAGVWNDVASELRRLGHRPVPLELPGVDDGPRHATLDDQVSAIVAAIDRARTPLVVVGHSAAATLAWIAADRLPDQVARVVFVGGFPADDGDPYTQHLEVVDGVVPFPGWAPFEGADAVDLDESARRRFAIDAVPVPAGVALGTVRLENPRRYDIPATLVCPEFDERDVRAWIDAGDLPELAALTRLEFVEIESGHWPMLTRAHALARILAAAAI